MNSMKRQNDRILKEEFPRTVGAQYATGDQWRNNCRKNEGMEPKQKEYPVVDAFHFHTLEKEMATHSSALAWRIPWTEKPGRLQSMGLQRVRPQE